MGKFTVKVLKTLDENFLREWEKLWSESLDSHFYNHPRWFLCCLEALGIENFLVFVFEKEKEMVAIFPLVWDAKFGVRVLCSPGENNLDRSTLITKSFYPSLIREVFSQASKYGNLYFAEVSQKIIETLPEGNSIKIRASISPFLFLERDPLRFLSKKERNQIVNRYKRNKNHLVFKHHTENIDVHLQEVREVDSESSKKLKGLKTFSDSEKKKLLIKVLAKRFLGSVSVDILYFNKKPIVYNVGYVSKRVFYLNDTGFIKEYSSLSPGKILLYLLLVTLKKEGFEVFDFTRGDSILKREFTRDKLTQYDFYYSESFLIKIWWKVAIFGVSFLKGNPYLYQTFCTLRKNIFFLKRLIS